MAIGVGTGCAGGTAAALPSARAPSSAPPRAPPSPPNPSPSGPSSSSSSSSPSSGGAHSGWCEVTGRAARASTGSARSITSRLGWVTRRRSPGPRTLGCRVAEAILWPPRAKSLHRYQDHRAPWPAAMHNERTLAATALTGVAVMIKQATKAAAAKTRPAPQLAKPARRGTPSAVPRRPPALPIAATGWWSVSLPVRTQSRPDAAMRASPSPTATRPGSERAWRRIR